MPNSMRWYMTAISLSIASIAAHALGSRAEKREKRERSELWQEATKPKETVDGPATDGK